MSRFFEIKHSGHIINIDFLSDIFNLKKDQVTRVKHLYTEKELKDMGYFTDDGTGELLKKAYRGEFWICNNNHWLLDKNRLNETLAAEVRMSNGNWYFLRLNEFNELKKLLNFN